MRLERRAEEPNTKLEKGLDIGAISDSNRRGHNYGGDSESEGGRSGETAGSRHRRVEADGSRTFRRRAMYETLMEAVVADGNCRQALAAVKRNQGAAGIDRMTTA